MSENINTSGRFFILNEIERPQPDLITEKRKDGFYYIHPKFEGVKGYHAMQARNPTPVEDFGISLVIEDGVLKGRNAGLSHAKYRDGRTRKWQGALEFEIKMNVLPDYVEPKRSNKEECKWKHDDYHYSWDTECGECFTFNEGTPADNKAKFCQYCGGVILLEQS